MPSSSELVVMEPEDGEVPEGTTDEEQPEEPEEDGEVPEGTADEEQPEDPEEDGEASEGTTDGEQLEEPEEDGEVSEGTSDEEQPSPRAKRVVSFSEREKFAQTPVFVASEDSVASLDFSEIMDESEKKDGVGPMSGDDIELGHPWHSQEEKKPTINHVRNNSRMSLVTDLSTGKEGGTRFQKANVSSFSAECSIQLWGVVPVSSHETYVLFVSELPLHTAVDSIEYGLCTKKQISSFETRREVLLPSLNE
jgi:hypothetical protein